MKNIVITGASGGIGRALALQFLQNPEYRVFLISRDKTKLESLAKEIPDPDLRLVNIPFDLQNDDYSQVFDKIIQITNSIDILINNAGALVNKPFSEISHSDFERIVNINYRGPFFLIQKLLPLLISGSHIVNISSMGGFQGSVKFSGLSLYSSSKGALSTLTEVLAAELREQNISVNCLAIGSVQTEMLEQAFPGYQAPINADSIANFIYWFACNAHTWMNGKIIPVSLSTP